MKCRLTFLDIDYDWEPYVVSSLEELRAKAREFFFTEDNLVEWGSGAHYGSEPYLSADDIEKLNQQIDSLTGEKEESIMSGGGFKETMYVTPVYDGQG